METVSNGIQQGLDATPYFKDLLDTIRADKDKIREVIDELGYIDGKDAAVKEKLERTFYSAIMLQRNAIESRDEQEMEFADGTSLLAFHMGYHNEYLPAHEYPKGIKSQNYVSGAELKKLQVQNMRATLQSIIDDPTKDYDIQAEAELRLAAVDRYVEAAHFTDVEDAHSDDEHVSKTGNIFKEKLGPFVTKAAAAVALSAMTLIVSANGSHALEKNPIDDETYDPDDPARKKVRKLSKPIALAPPLNNDFKPPARLEGTPPSAIRPDGSIKIAAPADNNFKPPVIVEASPGPNIITIPTVPNAPPAAPAPAIERAPVPEFIIDPGLAGETKWTAGQLEQVRANFGVYHEVQKETGVPWEVMAALHMREFSLQRVNPANGQGIYQLYSTGIYFAPGPVSDEEFRQQTILAAKFLLGKAGDNSRVGGPLDYSNPDKIKDVLFAYNGLASQYFQQAARLGFALGAEGSPYVMNMADDRRNSDLNPGWGQILVDNGPLGKANKAPGAWPLIEGLRKINQISHDQIAAQRAAEDAAAAAAAEAARKAAEAPSNGILAGWPNDGEAAMKMFNQCDPSWGEIRTPLGIRACNVSCGPTSVAMAVNALIGKPVNPGDVIQFTNNNRMWLPGDNGTSFKGVIDMGKNFGINGYQLQNYKDINAYKEVLQNGGMVLVAGSGPVPFVPAPAAHFVLIRGITADGKFLVADPYPKTSDTNTKSWDANQIINGTFGAVVFTK